MNITQLIVYPVKSLKGINVTQSELQGHGLAWDRRWMLVDAQQRFVTQRQLPQLATIAVELTDQALVLSHPNVDPIAIPLEDPQGNLRLVKVWNDHCKAVPESEDVSHWLVAALGEQAQGISLVRFATEFTRSVEEDFLAGGEAHTYFSDGYPFLITTTLAFLLYFGLLASAGATATSTVTFLVPVSALLWGYLLLNETLSLQVVAGMVITLAGTAIATRLLRLRSRGALAPPHPPHE